MSPRHIGSLEWSFESAGRIGVYRIPGFWGWCVCDDRGRIFPRRNWLARFDEHSEAIAYAQERARKDADQ